MNKKPSQENNDHLDIELYNQVFDSVDLISRSLSTTSSDSIEDHKNIKFEIFFRSYSIASTLCRTSSDATTTSASSSFHSERNSIISHLLFASTVNSPESSRDLFQAASHACRRSSDIYDIYRDPNLPQALTLKSELKRVRERIESVLADWPQDPILRELLKLTHRIESFELSEPLMKYLTGVELLLERAQKWEIVAAKQFSLDEELKRLNSLVVEWRKLELKHWLGSIDLELEKSKRSACFVWFFTIISLCVEFVNKSDYSDDEVLKTFNQFILSSTVGDYHLRIKNFR